MKIGHFGTKNGSKMGQKRVFPQLIPDHMADLAQRDQALAKLTGVMPGGQAGPFASAQARSRALMLPMDVGGTIWSDWVCSTAWS